MILQGREAIPTKLTRNNAQGVDPASDYPSTMILDRDGMRILCKSPACTRGAEVWFARFHDARVERTWA